MLKIALVGWLGLGVAACSGSNETTPSTSVLAGAPVMVPVERVSEDSRFCQMMLTLTNAEESEPSLATVISGYREVLDEVPREIAAEFAIVLDRLIAVDQGGDVLGTEQADEASLMLSEFVDMHCRATVVSPLPPPTQPLSE